MNLMLFAAEKSSLRMRMFVCLALLLWVAPADAQKRYSLSVSIHKDVQPRLTEKVAKDILRGASDLLKRCGVTFELAGPIRFFAPGTPKDIIDEATLEAVHRESADVKVVRSIKFCRIYKAEGFVGCGWRRYGPKTMIVTQKVRSIRPWLWAHEFGHTTGLWHRADDMALMTPCAIQPYNVQINAVECRCFLAGPGPGACQIPEPKPHPVCTETRRR